MGFKFFLHPKTIFLENIMLNTRKFLQTAVCASVLALGAASVNQAAWAQPAAPAVQAQGAAQGTLSIREVYDLLEKQGYHNFTEIELKRRGREYEVKADNASRQYVKLYVDAQTGRVLSERRRRD